MENNKIVILNDKFKNEESGELTDGVTIIIDGQVKQILDIIISKEEFENYTEAVKEIFFKGIHSFVNGYKQEK
ncbi:hypothetical protein [Paenibacillus sp. EZ-K15]|uniref:hypothetical protein n=1 Tax=Paenibacillus sp. EZ-K15 TaxID=2044275 RepID=UPI000BF4075D|nr:hypothetical protein [Paenibacillus sp. EZ-K15]